MTGADRTLSEKPMGFTGLGPGERANQLDYTGTQSGSGHDRYHDHLNNGNDLAHQFDFNLSMLSTADDSPDFGFLPDNPNEWPTLPYGLQGGNVYSQLQANPIDHVLVHMLMLSHRELQPKPLSNIPFYNNISSGLLHFDVCGILGNGSTT